MIFNKGYRFSNSIGFIGVGKMGSGMIQNLARQYPVVAYDTNPKFMEDVANKSNITTAASVAAVAKQVSTVVTMLPNDKIVSSVCDTLFANLPKGSLILDSSTISPFSAIENNVKASQHNLTYLDAPVSGGVGGAAAGTLSFMLGTGDEALFSKCETILKSMGKNIFNCQKPGGGQSAKICNNMALAIEMMAVAEALALGVRLGLDPALLTKIMNVSTSRCWSSDTYNPAPGVMPTVPSSRNYEGGFAAELMLKDLTIAVEVAKRTEQGVPLGSHIHQIYSDLVRDGLNRKDFSVVYEQLLQRRLK